MAIYRCEVCDEFIDNDHDCGNSYKEGTACDSCSELVICGTCTGPVEEGELNNDGECGGCAWATEADKREAHADDQYDRRRDEAHEYEQEQKDTARTLGEGE